MTEVVLTTWEKVEATAEALFAKHGYESVTLRQITSAAGVNLASVNYHYNDKQSLFSAILTSRLRLLSAARRQKLDDAQREAGESAIPIRIIIESLARPLLCPTESQFTAASRRLVGRALTEPLPFLAPLLAAELQPMVTRHGQALRRHFARVPPADFLWRYSFVIGSLHHTAATLHDMRALTSGICASDDAEAALRNFCYFSESALRSDDVPG